MTPRIAPNASYKKGKFLEAFARTGMIGKSAVLAGVNRKTTYRWRRDDQTFSKAFEEAKEEVLESFEAEARRRAIEGTDEPVYQGGKLAGTIRRFSDVLLIFMLKSLKPEKYRDSYDHFSNTPNASDAEGARERLQKKLERLAARSQPPQAPG